MLEESPLKSISVWKLSAAKL